MLSCCAVCGTAMVIAARAVSLRMVGKSAPEGIRTPDPLLRRQLLYPTELQALYRGERIRTSDPLLPKQVR